MKCLKCGREIEQPTHNQTECDGCEYEEWSNITDKCKGYDSTDAFGQLISIIIGIIVLTFIVCLFLK